MAIDDTLFVGIGYIEIEYAIRIFDNNFIQANNLNQIKILQEGRTPEK